MPSPPSLGGAGLSEVAQAVRLPVRRVHLAFRRCRQRPSIDRWALDFRQYSVRHVTRVSPSHGFSVFAPFPALSACSCSLTLSGSGKPLTQGSPLNPSHLRWGCCRNYCGAPDAGGSQLQAFVSRPHLGWTAVLLLVLLPSWGRMHKGLSGRGSHPRAGVLRRAGRGEDAPPWRRHATN
jgi:hypothetical protein